MFIWCAWLFLAETKKYIKHNINWNKSFLSHRFSHVIVFFPWSCSGCVYVLFNYCFSSASLSAQQHASFHVVAACQMPRRMNTKKWARRMRRRRRWKIIFIVVGTNEWIRKHLIFSRQLIVKFVVALYSYRKWNIVNSVWLSVVWLARLTDCMTKLIETTARCAMERCDVKSSGNWECFRRRCRRLQFIYFVCIFAFIIIVIIIVIYMSFVEIPHTHTLSLSLARFG